MDASAAALRLVGASVHSAADLSVDPPLQRLVAVIGISGSGKGSTLARGMLFAKVQEALVAVRRAVFGLRPDRRRVHRGAGSSARFARRCRVSACTRRRAVKPAIASGWSDCAATSPGRHSPLAYERVQCDAAGRVVLKLKTPWRDGTTHLVMTPLEFMQRLAALVPKPRLHLIRFHGVLAPNAKLRAQVVPAGPADEAGACLHSGAVEPEPDDGHRWGSRIAWALLLERVFEFDTRRCPNCGGELKVIAAIAGYRGHRAHPRASRAARTAATTLAGARRDATRSATGR